MITLSKGYKKPQNTDTGDIVFPALEDNWQRVNDHNHDGVNSQLLVLNKIDLTGSWTTGTGGLSYKDVALPTGVLYADIQLQFKLADQSIWYPSLSVLDPSTFRVYINTPQDVEVSYR